MFLSELILSINDIISIKKANKGLFDEYTIHKFVYSLFDKNGSHRILYSVEDSSKDSSKRILIQCQDHVLEPDFGKIRTVELPKGYLDGKTYRFRISVNPSKKVVDKNKRASIDIRDEDGIRNWFHSVAERNGFSVRKDSLSIEKKEIVRIKRKPETMVFGKVVLSGTIEVVDPGKFKDAVFNGIGKEKAFGCGLLRLIPTSLTKEL